MKKMLLYIMLALAMFITIYYNHEYNEQKWSNWKKEVLDVDGYADREAKRHGWNEQQKDSCKLARKKEVDGLKGGFCAYCFVTALLGK